MPPAAKLELSNKAASTPHGVVAEFSEPPPSRVDVISNRLKKSIRSRKEAEKWKRVQPKPEVADIELEFEPEPEPVKVEVKPPPPPPTVPKPAVVVHLPFSKPKPRVEASFFIAPVWLQKKMVEEKAGSGKGYEGLLSFEPTLKLSKYDEALYQVFKADQERNARAKEFANRK